MLLQTSPAPVDVSTSSVEESYSTEVSFVLPSLEDDHPQLLSSLADPVSSSSEEVNIMHAKIKPL